MLLDKIAKEFRELIDDKEANKEIKLLKRVANKKVFSSFILVDFLLTTVFCNVVSNSIESLNFLLKTGEANFNLLKLLLVPNFTYLFIYLLAYLIVGGVIIHLLFNIKASFGEIAEGQKGTSRFTTIDEIKDQYKSINEVETEEEFKAGGYEGKGGVLISRIDKEIFIDDSASNNLIIGTTRSGKGELFVFPMIDIYSRAKDKASLIVNDPKGELYSASKEILEKRGYNVKILNLINPDNSMSYSPLQLIIEAVNEKDYSTAQSLCKTLTHMLYYKPNVKDPFWQISAMSLVNGLILAVIGEVEKKNKILKEKLLNEENKLEYLNSEKDSEKIKIIHNKIEDYKKEIEINNGKRTLYTVANMLSELGSKYNVFGENELDVYFNNLDDSPISNAAKMQYATSNFSKDSAKGSILSVAMSELSIFTTDEIAKLTSRNSITLKDIGFDKNKPTAIFMATPDYDSSNHILASIFVRQVYYVLAKQATFSETSKCYREVIFLLDEAGNMPAIEGLASIITVCLGRNIKFNLIIQAISQLKKIYGDDYKTIMGNCSNKIYIFSNEEETAEEFSKLVGNETIITHSRSGNVLDLTKHQTETVDGKRLITSDELMQLQEGQVVIVRGIKRRDLKGNKITPYPIFNKGETTLKYRYEYLSDFFDNSKNLMNDKIDSLHRDIELKDLRLFDDYFKKNKKTDKEESKEILISDIFSNEEIDNINRDIGVRVNKEIEEKFEYDKPWEDAKELLEDYNQEVFNNYIKLAEERLKNK